ncbi:hypothetical protein FB2170_14313 [Maribacter sp. HTCC2170]|nr:hypothetical protein FB2170_14313 [Maribacter sp. HTCC2170]
MFSVVVMTIKSNYLLTTKTKPVVIVFLIFESKKRQNISSV